MTTSSDPQLLIFISHSSEDNDFGKKLTDDLRRALGYDNAVWFDSHSGRSGEGGLQAGDDWWTIIRQELTVRPIYIVILSPTALASRWVRDEINMAWRLSHKLDKRIFPIIYRPCEWGLAYPDLATLRKQTISFLPPKRHEDAFAELLQALEIPTDLEQKGGTPESEKPEQAIARQAIPRIEMAFQEQDWQKVREYVDILEQDAPTGMRPRFYRMRGQALFMEGEVELAQEDFDNALTLIGNRNEQLDLLHDITFLFISGNLWDQVLHYAQEALRLAPTDASWLIMRRVAQSKEQEFSSVEMRTRSRGNIPNIANLLQVLRKFHSKGRFYVHPAIPGNKLTTARNKCNVPSDEQILGLIDCTTWGTAKECLLFGTKGIYFHYWLEAPGVIQYSDFPDHVFAKQRLWHGRVVVVDNDVNLLLGGSSFSAQKLCDLLNAIKELALASNDTHRPSLQQNAPPVSLSGTSTERENPESQASKASPTIEPLEPNKSDVPPASIPDTKGVRVLTPDLFDKFIEQARKPLSHAQEQPFPPSEHTEEADLAVPQSAVPPSVSIELAGVERQMGFVEPAPVIKPDTPTLQADAGVPTIEPSEKQVSNVPSSSIIYANGDQTSATDRFDKFTEQARKVLSLAQEEARRFSHNYIGTEHLLLGLVREDEGVAARVLKNRGVELNKVRSAVEFIIGWGDRIVLGEIGPTPRAKKVIELAVDEARHLNHHYIGTEHLLLGLVREGEGIAAGVLESLGVNLEKVRAETIQVLDQTQTPSATDRASLETERDDQKPETTISPPAISVSNPDLNAKYREGLMKKSQGDLEGTARLWQEILDIDPQFGNGTLAIQMEELRQEIHSARVQYLRNQAKEAKKRGEWEQEIRAWQSLLDEEPDDTEAQKYLSIAAQNLKNVWLYENAEQFVTEGQLAAAKAQLQRLWKAAPYHGDPKGLARKVGLSVPSGFEEKEREETLKQAYGGRGFVSLSFFCLLSGIGSTFGFVTQSWPPTVGLVVVLASLAYLLGYRKLLPLLIAIGITTINVAITFGLSWYVSTLHYSQPQISHLWLIGDRMLWLGRQADFGVILGGVLCSVSLIFLVGLYEGKKLDENTFTMLFASLWYGLPAWLIINLVASLFGWGFGFGFGWPLNLISFLIILIGETGLGPSIIIWMGNKKMQKHIKEVKSSSAELPPPLLASSPLNPDLNAKYRAGVVKKCGGDLEGAAKLWQELLDVDPQFGYGTFAGELEEIKQEIISIQMQHLRDQAREAGNVGKWEAEIKAWEALLELRPNDAQAQKYLPIAEHNRNYAWLYENAEQFVEEGYLAAAKTQLERLWKDAPYYGDPKSLARKVRIAVSHTIEEEEREESIKKTYGGPIFIGLSILYLLGGAGSTLGFVTQSWPLALGLVVILAPLVYLLSYRRLLPLPAMTGIAVFSIAVTISLTWYASTLHYSQSQISHFGVFGDQTISLGSQVDFGLIFGLLSAIILAFMILAIEEGEILIGASIFLAIVIPCMLLVWLVISFLSLLSQWGFGFGFGWYVSLIEPIIIILSGYGLGASLAIWKKERR